MCPRLHSPALLVSHHTSLQHLTHPFVFAYLLRKSALSLLRRLYLPPTQENHTFSLEDMWGQFEEEVDELCCEKQFSFLLLDEILHFRLWFKIYLSFELKRRSSFALSHTVRFIFRCHFKCIVGVASGIHVQVFPVAVKETHMGAVKTVLERVFFF